MFLLGFSGGYQIMQRVYQAEGKDLEPLADLLTQMILGTIIGARLGHCFFYEPGYFFSNPLEVFKVWNGGLASHGGAIGVLLVMAWHAKKHPATPFLWILDRMMMPIALTAGLIRIGNLMNSEILGKPTDGSWGFIFDHVDAIPRHPTQIYESFSYLALLGILALIYRLKKPLPPGLLVGVAFIGLFGARFSWEFFKENQVAFEAGLPLNLGQFLSIPFFIFGIGMTIWSLKKPESGSETT